MEKQFLAQGPYKKKEADVAHGPYLEYVQPWGLWLNILAINLLFIIS